MKGGDAPKVFISYTHDSTEHMERVLELSNRLRSEGVDCHIDQYEESPPEGWARWCDDRVEGSEFVLVVCTDAYERRFRGREEPGKGLGATWEGFVITQELYDHQGRNHKFIPVLFDSEDTSYIPQVLRGVTRYDASTEFGYEDLYRRLTRQPRVTKPELGKIRAMSAQSAPTLPPLERKKAISSKAVGIRAKAAGLVQRAKDRIRERQEAQAIPLCEQAAEIDPTYAPAFVQWGIALSYLKKFDEAVRRFQTAIRLDPQDPSPLIRWGRALLDMRRPREAIELFQRAGKLDPHDAFAVFSWGRALEDLKRFDQALAKYKRAAKLDPKFAPAFSGWGRALFALDDSQGAMKQFRRATEIDPRYAPAFMNWARTLEKMDLLEEAIVQYERATEADESYIWAFENWGQTLRKLGRYDEAIEKFKRALEIKPDFHWALIDWGDALQDLGMQEVAVEKYAKAAKLRPNNAFVYRTWSTALRRLGRHQEAKAKFLRYSELSGEGK